MIDKLSRSFMRNYFKSEKGVKIRVGHMWKYPGKFFPVGYPYHKSGMSGLLENDFINFRTVHMFNYIFNESVLITDSWNVAKENIVGVAPVIDVDSPNIDGSSNARLDCLLDNRAIDRFEEVRLILKDELKDCDEWDDARMMFSGNGFYIILKDTFDRVDDTVTGFLGLCDDVNFLIPEDIVDVKSTFIPNKYNKCPFTLHYKYNRLAIPLNKDIEISRDYLKDNCGLDCDVEKVIGDSGWDIN